MDWVTSIILALGVVSVASIMAWTFVPKGWRTIAANARYLPTRTERFAERGVAVSPAALLQTGPASVAHARNVLGPRAVGPDGCLTD